MSLRRFQNFQLGALDASRLNEMVDAIARLDARVAQMSHLSEPVKEVILALITGPGVASSTEEEECIPCVTYPFEEVGLAIAEEGGIESTTCVRTERIEGGLASANGAFLITFERTPNIMPGSVVKAHLASRAQSGTAADKGMVYVATPLVETSVFNGVVTAILDGTGKYEVGMDGSTESVIVEVTNIYESSGHYGALDEPVNECAELTPRRLRIGDLVLVWKHLDEYYTLAPTGFDVECLPCDTEGLADAQQAQAPQGADFIAYAMLKR